MTGVFALDWLKNHINKGKGKEEWKVVRRKKVGEENKLMSWRLTSTLTLFNENTDYNL